MKTKRITEFALSFLLSLSSLFSVAVPKVHAATMDTDRMAPYFSYGVFISLLGSSAAMFVMRRKKRMST